jgi:hypothetical protein
MVAASFAFFGKDTADSRNRLGGIARAFVLLQN